jgi:hypothetical protein
MIEKASFGARGLLAPATYEQCLPEVDLRVANPKYVPIFWSISIYYLMVWKKPAVSAFETLSCASIEYLA